MRPTITLATLISKKMPVHRMPRLRSPTQTPVRNPSSSKPLDTKPITPVTIISGMSATHPQKYKRVSASHNGRFPTMKMSVCPAPDGVNSGLYLSTNRSTGGSLLRVSSSVLVVYHSMGCIRALTSRSLSARVRGCFRPIAASRRSEKSRCREGARPVLLWAKTTDAFEGRAKRERGRVADFLGDSAQRFVRLAQ